jgi:hypothetical protein
MAHKGASVNRVLGVAAASAIFFLMAGCATVEVAREGAEHRFGKIVDRTDHAASARHMIDESHTAFMYGAVGLLVANLSGTPRHFTYYVDVGSGTTYRIISQKELSIGTCVEVWVKKDFPTQTMWGLKDAGIAERSC